MITKAELITIVTAAIVAISLAVMSRIDWEPPEPKTGLFSTNHNAIVVIK